MANYDVFTMTMRLVIFFYLINYTIAAVLSIEARKPSGSKTYKTSWSSDFSTSDFSSLILLSVCALFVTIIGSCCRKNRQRNDVEDTEEVYLEDDIYENCGKRHDLHSIQNELLSLKRHLAEFLDENRYLNWWNASLPVDKETDEKQKQLISNVLLASQAIADSEVAYCAEKTASFYRMPQPLRQETQVCFVCSDTDLRALNVCLELLQCEMKWFSWYVITACAYETDEQRENEVLPSVVSSASQRRTLNRRRSMASSRFATDMQRETWSAGIQTIKPLMEAEKQSKESLKTVLSSVTELVNIAMQQIEGVLLSYNDNEVPWILEDPDNRWWTNPESYYEELSAINPALSDLANRLAIVYRRLQTVEVVSRSPEDVEKLITEDGIAGCDLQWKARLLNSMSRIATDIEKPFDGIKTCPETAESGVIQESSPQVETESDILWHLSDGASFYELLIRSVDRLVESFDSVTPAMDQFFERYTQQLQENESQMEPAVALVSNDQSTVSNNEKVPEQQIAPSSTSYATEFDGSAARSLHTLIVGTIGLARGVRSALDLSSRSIFPSVHVGAASNETNYIAWPAQNNYGGNDDINSTSSLLHEEELYSISPALDSALQPADNNTQVIPESLYPPDELAVTEYIDFFQVTVDRLSDEFIGDIIEQYIEQPADVICAKSHAGIEVSFKGEAGIDGGGLRREFFHLVFRTLTLDMPTVRNRQLFQGRGPCQLLPVVDTSLIDWRVFWFVGVVTVQAARAGCRGLPGLCNGLRHFLAGNARMSNINEIMAKYISLNDVADDSLRELLIKIQDNDPLGDGDQELLDSWLVQASFTRVFSPSTAADAVQQILRYYVFDSRMSQLQAIAEGMADMMYKPGEVDLDLLFPKENVLTIDDVLNGLDYQANSDDDSREKLTTNHFRSFIEEINDGKIENMTLEDLLQFISGAPYFTTNHPLTVKFLAPKYDNPLPIAHTCARELLLPTVHRRYGSFRRAMTTALEYGGVGFGLA